MFVCFFASTFTSFISIFLTPLAIYSRLTSIPIALFTLLSALMTLTASTIATAMWTIFKNEILNYADQLHIIPTVGQKMFIFVWVASGCSLVAALGQLGMLCCGTSRRDIKTGRRVGRKMRERKVVALEEDPALRRRWWGSVSQ